MSNNGLIQFVDRLCKTPAPELGLAVFRMAYTLVLLGELLQAFYFRHLIFDPVPFIQPGPTYLPLLLLTWIGVTGCLFLGLFTRPMAIVNYLLTLFFMGYLFPSEQFSYHLDYQITGANLLLIFMPVASRLALDPLRQKLNSNSDAANQPPAREIHYFLPLFLCIALVYFDSTFHKLASNFWMKGLGFWYPASQPQATWWNLAFLLDWKELNLFLGILVLAFELIFIFVFWKKNWRLPLFLLGSLFHLGIVLSYPIPLFGLGIMAFYLLLIPLGFWNFLENSLTARRPRLIFFFDDTCHLCHKTRNVLEHFDFRKAIRFQSIQSYLPDTKDGPTRDAMLDNVHCLDKNNQWWIGLDAYRILFLEVRWTAPLFWALNIPGIRQLAEKVYLGVATGRQRGQCRHGLCQTELKSPSDPRGGMDRTNNFLLGTKRASILILIIILLQSAASLQAPLFTNVKTILKDSAPGRFLLAGTRASVVFSRFFLGITPHGVFMDSHFKDYNTIWAATYRQGDGEEQWLPIVNSKGQIEFPTWGRFWVHWSFAKTGPHKDHSEVMDAWKQHSLFWAHKLSLDLNRTRFFLKRKLVDIPMNWTPHALRRAIQQPWTETDSATWSNHSFLVSDIQPKDGAK